MYEQGNTQYPFKKKKKRHNLGFKILSDSSRKRFTGWKSIEHKVYKDFNTESDGRNWHRNHRVLQFKNIYERRMNRRNANNE